MPIHTGTHTLGILTKSCFITSSDGYQSLAETIKEECCLRGFLSGLTTGPSDSVSLF